MTAYPFDSDEQQISPIRSLLFDRPRKPLAESIYFNLPERGTATTMAYLATSSERSTAEDDADESRDDEQLSTPVSASTSRGRRMAIEDLTHPSPPSTLLPSPPFRQSTLLPPPSLTTAHYGRSPSYHSASPATATESSFTRSPPPATPSHDGAGLSPKIVSVNDSSLNHHLHLHHHHILPYPINTASTSYRPSSPSAHTLSPSDASPATTLASFAYEGGRGGSSAPRRPPVRRHSSTRMQRASPPPIIVTREDDGDVDMAEQPSPESNPGSRSGAGRGGDGGVRDDSTRYPQTHKRPSTSSPSSASHSELYPGSPAHTMGPSNSRKEKEYRGQWANATGTRTGLTPGDMIAVDAPTKSKRRSHQRETSAVATSRAAGGSFAPVSIAARSRASPAAQRSAHKHGRDARSSSSAEEDAQLQRSPDELRSDELATDDGMQEEVKAPLASISAAGVPCETSSLQLTLPLSAIDTFSKDQRSQWKTDGVPFTLSAAQKAMLSADELSEWQVTVKRRKNTVAARSTRRRKLETQKILEDENVRLKTEMESLRERLETGTRERLRLQRRTNAEERKLELRSKQVGALEQALEEVARRLPQLGGSGIDAILEEIMERRELYEREYRSGVERLTKIDELLSSPKLSTSDVFPMD